MKSGGRPGLPRRDEVILAVNHPVGIKGDRPGNAHMIPEPGLLQTLAERVGQLLGWGRVGLAGHEQDPARPQLDDVREPFAGPIAAEESVVHAPYPFECASAAAVARTLLYQHASQSGRVSS